LKSGEQFRSIADRIAQASATGLARCCSLLLSRSTFGSQARYPAGIAERSQGNRNFGYDYVPRTTTSPPAIVMNQQEANGTGLQGITRTLEEREVLTKSGKKLWRAENVRYLLQNETYTGIRYFNRMTSDGPAQGREHGRMILRARSEWVGVPVPAIVPQELFVRVQARMQQVREKYSSRLQPRRVEMSLI
jgi:hypothetical protein